MEERNILQSNGHAHMTKVAAMATYAKNTKMSFSPDPAVCFELGSKHLEF